MTKIKVSIICITYNAPNLLERCLDSCINQTLNEIEIILVNDGSTDNTDVICKQYAKKDSRIKYYTKENGGASSAMNVGYKHVKGEYIHMLDGDDYMSPDLCEKSYSIAKKLNLDLLNFGYAYEKNGIKEKRLSVFPKNTLFDNNDFIELLKNSPYDSKLLWFTWMNLIKTELLTDFNIIHNEELAIGIDSSFNLECYLNAKRMYSIDDVLYYYVYNPNSLTQTNYKPNLTKDIKTQFNVKLELYKKYNLTNISFKIDFSRYYLQHSLLFILNNELNYKGGFKSSRINKIRSLRMFEYCFKHYKPSTDCPQRAKLIIWFFKNRLYFPIQYLLYK